MTIFLMNLDLNSFWIFFHKFFCLFLFISIIVLESMFWYELELFELFCDFKDCFFLEVWGDYLETDVFVVYFADGD